MSYCLPKEAESLVDETSTLKSIRNLADAVDRGEIDISALLSFAKAAGNGVAPRFAKAKQLPLAMLNAIRSNPEKPPRQIVYAGVSSGAWTMQDAERYEENEAILSERARKKRPTKGVYLTRARRTHVRRTGYEDRFFPKMNVEAVMRTGICSGAVICLGHIMSLAGKATEITTYTTSLAALCQKSTRTVRNYYVQLEEAGLISRRPGMQYNTVHLTIHPDCAPSAYVEAPDVKAFKLARKSGNPGLHLMAMSVVIASFDAHPESFATSDRRKQIAGFNLESNSLVSRLSDVTRSTTEERGRIGSGREGLVAPTTHSTLLTDPRKPLQGKRYDARSRTWASPTGFSQIAGR